MKVSVMRPQELSASEVSRWHELQQADDRLQSPFLSPEFACAVGRVRDEARVAALEDGQEVVGFFAFERRRFGIGRPIGSGVSDCQAVVLRADWRWDARELLRGCGLAAWSFDNLVASQTPFARHHRRLHASPVIDLRRGFAAYVAERREVSRTLVSSTRQQARKLEREVGPLRVEFDTTDNVLLRTLMRWKSAQYLRTDAVDRFSVDWIVQLLDHLLDSRAPWCASSLSVLYAGDRPVAAHFGLRSPRVLSYWFPAYDVAFQRYSPGRYLLLRLAEAAAEQGIGHLDLGRGHEEYKQRFASREIAVAEGAVERAGLVGAAHAAVGLPRALGVRYVAASPLAPLARRALTTVRRVRKNVD